MQRRACSDSQLYDPFFQLCRSVVCPMSGEGSDTGRCVNGSQLVPADAVPGKAAPSPPPYANMSHLVPIGPGGPGGPSGPSGDRSAEAQSLEHFIHCPKFLLEKTEYSLAPDASNATVMAYHKTFRRGEFVLMNDGRLEICADAGGIEYVDKFGPYMG